MQLLMLPILFGLGLITIPVVIHLLHRQKTTPIAWGAMQFLIPTRLQAKRRKKVEHWLLMLLRVGALAVLVFLLARPIWKANPFSSADGNAPTDVAVVIDHSFSTGRRAATGDGSRPDDRQTVFDRAIAGAHEIAAQLRPNDTLTIILAEHKPKPLVDRPVAGASGELTQLRQALSQLKPGLGDGDVPSAVQAARERISHGRNTAKRIVVLGDEQRTGWQVENTAMWKTALSDGAGGIDKNTAVFDVPIAVDASVSNVSVARVDVHPAVLGPGAQATISATLTNSGGAALNHLPVNLVVDGQPAGSQTIDELAGASSRTVRFEQTFSKPGSHWAKVSVQVVDGLEADNSAVVALNVLEQLPVLVIDGQLTSADTSGSGSFRNSQFLAAALEPDDPAGTRTALIRPRIIGASDASQSNFDEYAAVVVNDVGQLPPQTLSRLADYAAAGHGVWVILGPRTQPKWAAEQMAAAGLFSAEIADQPKLAGRDAANPAQAVAVNDPSNPMVAVLTTADRNGLAEALTTGWWPIKPTEADERVILGTANGDPLVMERLIGNRGGRVVLWATSADGAWNNWPLATNFVPLVQETMLHLAGGAIGAGSRVIDAGKPLVWSGAAATPVISASITRPDGTVPARVLMENGKPTVRYDDANLPGLYEMRFSPTGIPQPVYFGVGIDPRELDSSLLSEKDIKSLRDAGFITARVSLDKIATLVGKDDGTSEMWPWMALVVLGILVMETYMTYRMIRLQASKPLAA